ncbi:MAG: RNA-binding protein [Methyloprofundus sp.]|nr:RNA-binding protein [Methyloprofundus sp.]
MIIFLRNIPENTKHSDIIAFVEPAIKKRWFQKKGEIVSVKVMQLNDPRAGTTEFHGLVTIEPDKVGAKVIRRLNRKLFLAKHIAVHEYHRRNWHNDPRLERTSNVQERRKADRRRKDLEEAADISKRFTRHKTFSRQFL